MNDPRLARLATLAALLRDHRLAAVQAVVAKRDRAVAMRAGLVAEPSDDPASLQAQALYGRWAEARHRALGAEIAAHEAQLAEKMAEARIALARAEVLARLRDQLS